MKKFIYLCGMMLLSLNIFAQEKNLLEHDTLRYCHGKHYKYLNITYHPSQIGLASGWRYDTIMSDEFHNTTIDTTKWRVANKKYHPHFTSVGYVDNSNNICIMNDSLVMSFTDNVYGLWCTKIGNDNDSLRPSLLSGWLSSKHKIQYGYIETECYLPKNHHYWPCFWTTGRDTIIDDYDEVDVFERTDGETLDGIGTDHPYILRQNCYNGSGTHHPESFLSSILNFTANDSITGRPSVFGVEILPREIVFYINGRVTSHIKFHDGWQNNWNTYTCTDIEEMLRTVIIFNLSCPATQTSIPLPHESATFKYFRCYKLDRGDIDTYHPTIFSPSDESTKVYSHVILGGTGCVASVSSPTAIWAEQDIILDKGFELSAGTSFSARVISVPDHEDSDLYIRNCR